MIQMPLLGWRAARYRLPNAAHQAHAWVITAIARDFRLLDAWALPVHGRRGDFASLLELLVSFDPAHSDSAASRTLFALRLRLGTWFGWDDATKKRSIPGCTETTLGARLPEELRGSARTPVISKSMRLAAGFRPLYRTDDEWAAELSNATVHAVLHLAWVHQGSGRYRAELRVYVKPRGIPGEAYMMLIEPFRQLIVYPALMRQIERAWVARRAARLHSARVPV
jgi:uncharacterized protein DUF2867